MGDLTSADIIFTKFAQTTKEHFRRDFFYYSVGNGVSTCNLVLSIVRYVGKTNSTFV